MADFIEVFLKMPPLGRTDARLLLLDVANRLGLRGPKSNMGSAQSIDRVGPKGEAHWAFQTKPIWAGLGGLARYGLVQCMEACQQRFFLKRYFSQKNSIF